MLYLIGRFPPPFDGQTLATQRLAGLLEPRHEVRRVDASTGTAEHIQARVRFSMDKVRHYARIRGRIRSALAVSPEASVLWASISPSVWGHLRDVLTALPAFPDGQPVFAIIHWGDFDRIFRQPLTRVTARRMVRRLRGFVFLNEHLAEACAPWIPASKRFVIPNTLDADVICTDEEVAAKQAERNGRQRLRLLYLSNMIPSKGYLDVLHAVRLLHARGVALHADFAGRWTVDADRAAFEQFVVEHGLSEVITHHGGISERARIKALHLQADVFLLPTYYPTEAQPVAILEALNAGTPIVTTRHAGIPDMVREDHEARFVPSRFPEAIADAVRHLADFSRWQAFSGHARRRFLSHFSPDAVRRQWERLLEDL